MLTWRRQLGLRARWFTGDEVYGGHELRRSARRLCFDYALSVRTDQQVATPGGRFSATTLAARLPGGRRRGCSPVTA
ncbi:hypothetical protein ACH4TV_46885 [Streptomyces sp. NPDC020898]|uniref:hypothetical protein n=1 Tax=Streptomyces sp. NPDC020898 TaxID=3365101 RepID=UPI00378F5903